MNQYIGILGGLGYRATQLVYQKLNQRYEKIRGPGHSCPIRLLSVDFFEMNQLLPDRIDEVIELLSPVFYDVMTQPISCAIMINNTMHEALDKGQLVAKYQTPFGHIGDLIFHYLSKAESEQVMILGTKHTMNSEYWKQFIPDQVTLVRPSDAIQSQVEKLRRLYFSTDDSALAESVRLKLIQKYPHTHFIIACTELSIAWKSNIPLNYWIDTIHLQCEFAIEKLLESESG